MDLLNGVSYDQANTDSIFIIFSYCNIFLLKFLIKIGKLYNMLVKSTNLDCFWGKPCATVSALWVSGLGKGSEAHCLA